MADGIITSAPDAGANPAPPPAFEPAVSETKTDAERDYFKSRGEKGEGLFKAPDAKPAEKAPATNGNGKAEIATDVAGDGEIIVEADGTLREQKTGRFVPKSAFLRVKDEAKTAKVEAAALRESLIQARERLNILTEVLPKGEEKPATKTEAVAEPDPEQDIFAWVKWAKSQLSELSGKVTKTADESAKDRERGALQSFFASDVASFTKDNADFADALKFAMDARHKMHEALGVTDAAQRQALVVSEIHGLVKESHASKASVADKLYKVAKALGYTRKETVYPGKDKSAEALAEIERINTAQKTNKTLGNGGGGGVAEAATREKLAGMSDNDYSSARTSYIAKNGRQAWNDFLSGKR